MNDVLDLSLVDWSRAQFALTAMYHWFFVPLTLGITFIIAIMETIYVKTGSEAWKKATRFWMTLFAINFAIGVATGIILEFEFGTNWSNYSWFVGDIFGAPLAIEGIMAFFLETAFIAIMFFGWDKVGKKFHLTATWLTAIGTNLSALWILVANAWMQHPAGMYFNPDTTRNEMLNFWEVFLSPVAINKFLHTVFSSYTLAAIFVIGVSAWFILKKRNLAFAKKSMLVAAIFGIISSLYMAVTGDGSAYEVAQKQPMKLAAMEGLYEGRSNGGLTVFGILTPGKQYDDNKEPFVVNLQIPNMLSLLSYRDAKAFVPGIKDLTEGNPEQGIPATREKMEQGKTAIAALKSYKLSKEAGDTAAANESLAALQDNFKYFGYGYLNDPKDNIPHVSLVFYSFRIMVLLGFYFIFFFLLIIYFVQVKDVARQRWLMRLAVFSIPLAYIASQAGWLVAEMGRQPWVIQDIMPTVAAVSHLDTSSVQITFWLFVILFTSLLIAEIKIMTRQIKIGPKE